MIQVFCNKWEDSHLFQRTTIGFGRVTVGNIDILDIAFAIWEWQKGHLGAWDWFLMISGCQVVHG
jgi:hypothetical protein